MNVHYKNKCPGRLALAMLCLSIGTSYAGPRLENIPNFTPFNLEKSGTGYLVTGTIHAVGPNGPVAVPGTKMVIAPPNERVVFLFGPAGNFITDATGSYTWNLPGRPGKCYYYHEYDYASFVDHFGDMTSTPGSTNFKGRYTGYTKDSASCNHNITFTLIEELAGKQSTVPIIAEMNAALPSVAGNICRQGQTYFVADKETLDTTSNRDIYFQKPASCDNPDDYCSTMYPPGNPCAIPQ